MLHVLRSSWRWITSLHCPCRAPSCYSNHFNHGLAHSYLWFKQFELFWFDWIKIALEDSSLISRFHSQTPMYHQPAIVFYKWGLATYVRTIFYKFSRIQDRKRSGKKEAVCVWMVWGNRVTHVKGVYDCAD